MTNGLPTTKKILNKLHNSADVVCREIKVADKNANVVFVQDITDFAIINEFILEPLTKVGKVEKGVFLPEFLMKEVLLGREVKMAEDITDAIDELLKGKVMLIIENVPQIILIDAAKFVVRAITEPPTSTVLQGPREGFNESIKNNISLIRRRLSTPDLVIKNKKLGRRTKTLVSIVYLESIVKKDTIKAIEKKLDSIDIDGVLDSNYIAQFLQLNPNSIFKQVGTTEKPDIAVAKMLEGRVAILVDGSPLVLTLPFLVFENFQSSEDYYTNHHHGTFVRWIRLIGVAFAIFLPGTFVALQLFHYGIVPIKFLVTIANTTQGLPFTPLIEMLFIILLFELLNEASLRMPKYLGMAMSIIGALILGDTAVSAGLISPPAVMIVALSSMTSFTVADLSNQISLLRLANIVLGAVFGLFGILLGIVWLISYMASLDSYGTPFLAPMVPYIKSDMQDFLNVRPRVEMVHNPISIPNKNKIRNAGSESVNNGKLDENENEKIGQRVKGKKVKSEKVNYVKNKKENEKGGK